MPPEGNPEQQLAAIDRRLANVGVALREARGEHEPANAAICQQRYDELLDERNRIAKLIPKQRDA